MTYKAPLAEQMFVLETIAGLGSFCELGGFEEVSLEMAAAVLEEAAKVTESLFYPANHVGDREEAKWVDGNVTLPRGFCEAYQAWVEGGWNGLEGSPDYGGQGLPLALSAPVQEQMFAANLSLSQIMSLTAGAVRAITAHGSDELKARYLPQLISGEWSGTMNLTEPQAGSDVGALRTSARKQDDGTYLISGSKIFITNGEHDAAKNIIHLVLARIEGAPSGTKGISLFLVPKFLVDEEGAPAERNDVRCTAIEHKLGIRASPTCSLSFGDEGRCVGYLVGDEHAGMRAMFTMMNHARIGVGLQGVGLAEAAYQKAVDYASERVQSAPINGGPAVRIIEHPDVRRNLLTMRSKVHAARALAYYASACIDVGHSRSPDGPAAMARAELLIPCVKAFCTDVAVEVASTAVQVFGGMGFIEETGIAQHYRDARILPIYEGTNGIQALDLVRRKLRLNNAWGDLLDEIDLECAVASRSDALKNLEQGVAVLAHGNGVLRAVTQRILSEDLVDSAGSATPYLRMFSLVVCGWLMLKQARAAAERLEGEGADRSFLTAKLQTADFFLAEVVPATFELEHQVRAGASRLFTLSENQLRA